MTVYKMLRKYTGVKRNVIEACKEAGNKAEFEKRKEIAYSSMLCIESIGDIDFSEYMDLKKELNRIFKLAENKA